MATWLQLVAIAVGGAVGSVLRYLITLGAASMPGGSSLIGTLVANVLGCAAIGALTEYCSQDDSMPERLRLALRVGLFWRANHVFDVRG